MKLFLNAMLTLLFFNVMSTQAATITGSIEFAHRISSSLPVSGTVRVLNVHVGQAIRKGDLLLSLDPLLFESAVIQAKSQLTIQNADYKEVKRDLNHAIELFDRGVLSTIDLQKATLNEKRAQARKIISKAELQRAQYLFENSSIVAPFDGWVLDVKVKAGENINNALSTQVMLVIAERGWYYAVFNLSLSSIKVLKLAKIVKLKVAGKRYSGKIVATGLEPIEITTGSKVRYKIHVKFKSNGDILRSGEGASIILAN